MRKHFYIQCHTLRVLLLMAALLSAGFAKSQTISGYVTDGSTSAVLQGAVVTVFSDKETQFYETGLDGFYSIDLYPRVYTLSCSRFGYETITIENIRLDYDKTEIIDIKLYKPGAKSQEITQPAYKEKEAIDNRLAPEQLTLQTSEPAFVKKNATAFRLNHAARLGVGFQLGEIGGIGAELGLSLSRLFAGSNATSNIFLLLEAGYEQQAYISTLFNDASLDYQFAFVRLDAGLQKIFVIGDKFLIGPSLSFGLEQAKPKTNNVHQLIDGGYVYALYAKPSVMLGYALNQSIALNLNVSYYAMMQETANKDNLILATKISGTEIWKTWSYSDDFFLKRKGFSLSLNISIYF